VCGIHHSEQLIMITKLERCLFVVKNLFIFLGFFLYPQVVRG
jgi:hypothetical protein